MEDGVFSLTSVKSERLPKLEQLPVTPTESYTQDFVGIISFLPNNPMSTVMIVASVHQTHLSGGTYSDMPTLSVNRLLPKNSKVLELVRAGRLEELRAMIDSGNASLGDRDQDGRSLLHVSADVM
jgi:hypothetical protein